MKVKLLSLLALSTLFSATAMGMSRGLPKIENQNVYDSKVVANFNLRATDGSVLKFSTYNSQVGSNLKYLPPEKNANYSICEGTGKKTDIDLFIKVSDISIKLLQQKRSLTSAETALIQKTPRCAPYLSPLNTIGLILAPEQPADVREEISSLTLKADKKTGNFLLVNTDSGKSAAFKISSDLKDLKIRELRDFTKVQILASQSGQNAAIKFALESIDTDEPSHHSSVERCDYIHSERQCRWDRETKEEKCEYITITEPGERRVERTSQTTAYDLRIDIVDIQNRVLATGKVRDLEFDYDSDEGTCYPIHGGHYGGHHGGYDDRDRPPRY
ncbi:hypothetical protein [Bdellovibrio sp. HCB337]|uniref:hypothetical protein n=1 Tax=Bdellovibrio sp. HCB337 TaxID=3394358 RepID=UPI0039A66492